MKRNPLKLLLVSFRKVVDAAIKECLRKNGKQGITLDEVHKKVKEHSRWLVTRLKVLLADRQIRIIIQHRLREFTVTPKNENKVRENLQNEAQQREFDFFQMEQFRGVRKMLAYEEGGVVVYKDYRKSLREHRIKSIAFKRKSVQQDEKAIHAEESANEWFAPLITKYGDLPACELVDLWRDEGGATKTNR